MFQKFLSAEAVVVVVAEAIVHTLLQEVGYLNELCSTRVQSQSCRCSFVVQLIALTQPELEVVQIRPCIYGLGEAAERLSIASERSSRKFDPSSESAYWMSPTVSNLHEGLDAAS